MPARALWKAVLEIASTKLPVRLYSAVEDRDVHLHLLHAADHERVHERLRRVDDQRVVDRSAAHSGYVLETGEVVLLDRKELATIAPRASRSIELLHCVNRDALPPAAFARAYWLGPDGDTTTYFALVEALRDAERYAIVAWVLRGKHHVGALSVHDDGLMLVELRSADQWLDSKTLQAPALPALNPREVAMAEQLVEGLAGPFEHSRFHDTYREQLQALIEAKARGAKPPKQRAPRRGAPERSLTDALHASLRALKKTGSSTADQERKSA